MIPTTIGIIVLLIIVLISFYFSLKKLKREIDQAKIEEDKIKKNSQHYIQVCANAIKEIEGKNEVNRYLTNLIKEKEDQKKEIEEEIKEKNQEKDEINNKIIQIKQQADKTYEEQRYKINERVVQFKKTAQESANYFFDNLEKVYQTAEAGHAEKMSRLQEELDGAAAQLEKIKNTRKAAHEALLKQQEIKDNKDNYRLLPSSFDIQDITALRHVKASLHKPRILSMLIWQTYFQPLAKEKFPIILQDKTKMGIYKITNIRTDECYIGQSVDIYKRWTDHCKAGLGIDAPAGNKLYKAMQDDGLYNFTFQLLCECPKQELDEKEKYFISLYQADLYGYNGNKGVNNARKN